MFKISKLAIMFFCMAGTLQAADYSKEIAEIQAGQRTEAHASWWGFNPDNATVCLQRAIDSGVKKLIVDNTGHEWLVTPIKLRNDQEIVFADGVIVRALPGAFKAPNDSLFTIRAGRNIILRGEGQAVLKMNKKDYQNAAVYSIAEWRNVLCLINAENITIKNLTLQSSGGDGIYLGRDKAMPDMNCCRNITIDNVICDDNLRQGISVISAENLTVKNSKFLRTKGTDPQTGIDFEPNNADEVLSNCVIENCEFTDNANNGIDFFLLNFTRKSLPISVSFRNCRFSGNGLHAATISTCNPVTGEHPTGKIEFIACRFTGKTLPPLAIAGQPQNGPQLIFRDCIISAVNRTAAIKLICQTKTPMENIRFENVVITGIDSNATLLRYLTFQGYGLGRIEGDITLRPNNGMEKHLNFADIARQYPDDPSVIAFKPVAWEATTPVIPVGKTGTVTRNLRFRKQLAFLQYAEKGQELPLSFVVEPVGNGKIRIPITIRKPNGQLLSKLEITATATPYILKAEESGAYSVDIAAGLHTVRVESATAGQALIATDPVRLFRTGGQFYFRVPEGVADINIKVVGEENEPVDAILLDPSGKTVASKLRIEGVKVVQYRRSNTTKAELWSIKFNNPVEDYSFMLGAPLSPLVATSPDNLLVSPEKH